MNQKSLDKKKTKELDFNDKLYDIWFESLCNGNYQMFQKKVKEMFTQQRTELLEEIKKDIQKYFSDMADLCFPNGSENGELIGSTHYYQLFGNELLKKLEKKKQNTNLLNKKDE